MEHIFTLVIEIKPNYITK